MSNRPSTRGVVAGPKARAPATASLWGVVLAEGGGVRLRALAQRICGDDRPKQYVPVLGDRTLLRQTLDRVALGIPSVRTAVVTLRPAGRVRWSGVPGRIHAGSMLCATARISRPTWREAAPLEPGPPGTTLREAGRLSRARPHGNAVAHRLLGGIEGHEQE